SRGERVWRRAVRMTGLKRRRPMEFCMLIEDYNFAISVPREISEEIPAIIRNELNADRDRDLIVRMRDLARKKRMRQPEVTDEEMPEYLALPENFSNFAQCKNGRRGNLANPRPTLIWIALTAVTVGLLTAMLIVAIAIAV